MRWGLRQNWKLQGLGLSTTSGETRYKRRVRKVVVLVVSFAMVASITILPAASLANGPVTIDSDGLWAIKDLGYADITLNDFGYTDIPSPEVGKVQASMPVNYRLPEGATQGPSSWYIIYLHFVMELYRDSAPGGGLVYLSGKANDAAGAQIKFGGLNLSDGILWRATELFNGSYRGFSLENTIELYYMNYLPYDGVRAGVNELTFQLERYHGAEVKRLIVFDDSGILRTSLEPPRLHMDLKVPRGHVEVGDEFTIGVELKNRGWPIKDVKLEGSYPEDALQWLSPGLVQLPSLRGSLKSAFTFRVLKEGLHVVKFEAAGHSGGRPQAEVRVDTMVSKRSRTYLGLTLYPWIGTGLLTIVSLVAVGWLVSHRKYRRLP